MSSFLQKGYGWPLLVVALLGSSVVMMGLVVIAARSDGGAQVIDDYYDQSIRWDSLSDVRNSAHRLGWTAQLDASFDSERISGVITLRDSTGTPLSGREALVTLRRPHLAENVFESTALEDSDSGSYVFQANVQGRGLWDVVVVFTDPLHSSTLVEFEWRRELR